MQAKIRTPIIISVIALVAWTGALTRAEEETQYQVNCYWTDTPPILDGSMDDECWQQAAVVSDFRMFQNADMHPTQQTEVRLCYDAENLYLFWLMHEEHMETLEYGPPEDFRDLMPFKDVIELFLDPGRTQKDYVQLAANPLGTRFDLSNKQGTRFDPEWRVVPGIQENAWTLEIAIPFRELAQSGEFIMTPAVGEVWGVQFCRNQARRHEWSHWRPTPRSFHEVDKFGTLVFRGRPDGTVPGTVRRLDDTPLDFGSGSVRLAVEGAEPYSAKGTLVEKNGETVPVDIADEAETINYQYRIEMGGDWTLDGEVNSGERQIAVFRLTAALPRVGEIIAAAAENLEAAQENLAAFEHPAAADLRAKAEVLAQTIASPRAALTRADTLDAAAWRRIVAETKQVESLWNDIEFDLFRVQTYPANGVERTFAVGVTGPLEKIYPGRRFNGSIETPVRLALAGGERESFQLVVIPFWAALENVTVVFSDLRNEEATIAADQASWFRVDYVHMEGAAPGGQVENEIEPDILMPGVPFTQPADELRALFIDIHAPRGTPAGMYNGSVRVAAGGTDVQIPLQVEVYGFDLPEVSSIENNFWFSPDHGWRRFYNEFDGETYSLELYEKHAETLSRYRISPFADSWIHMWQKMTVYHEPDGSFSFDFTEWEKFIQVGKKFGGTSYRASHGCNTAALLPFVQPWRRITDRATGETKTIKDIIDTEDWWRRLRDDEVSWADHPVYMAFLEQYVPFLERMGILETAYWEIHDEPNSTPRWLGMLKDHRFLRNHAPRLRLLNYGMHPLQRKADQRALGLIDTWAPHLTEIDDEVLAVMRERRAKFGEKYWFYTCTEKRDQNGNFSPFTYYNRPYMGPRITPWMAWQLQADGFLIFALSSVPEENVLKKDEDRPRWPEAPWSDGKYRGCGTLIYPGPDFEMIPSMRLASLRDGMEDYEYFHILKRQLAYLDEQDHPELWQRMDNELNIDAEIIESYFVWTKDQALLEGKRARLAKLIQEAMAVTGVSVNQ